MNGHDEAFGKRLARKEREEEKEGGRKKEGANLKSPKRNRCERERGNPVTAKLIIRVRDDDGGDVVRGIKLISTICYFPAFYSRITLRAGKRGDGKVARIKYLIWGLGRSIRHDYSGVGLVVGRSTAAIEEHIEEEALLVESTQWSNGSLNIWAPRHTIAACRLFVACLECTRIICPAIGSGENFGGERRTCLFRAGRSSFFIHKCETLTAHDDVDCMHCRDRPAEKELSQVSRRGKGGQINCLQKKMIVLLLHDDVFALRKKKVEKGTINIF